MTNYKQQQQQNQQQQQQQTQQKINKKKRYEVNVKKQERSLAKEIPYAAASSVFLGIGTLFLSLSLGLYV